MMSSIKKTEVETLSINIKRRQLNWPGHPMHRQKDTPARIALGESLKPMKKKLEELPLHGLS